MMKRRDERKFETIDLFQPADLGFSNGLGLLMRARRRMILDNALVPTISDRLVRLMTGRAVRRVAGEDGAQ